MLYSLPYILTVALQVYCIVHVLRRGRDYWWILIILFFPPIGGLVYLFVEILPEWRSRRRMTQRPGETGISVRKRIRQLSRELEFTDTVETRMSLAQAHLEIHEADKAIEVLEPSLHGPFEDDPNLKYTMAQAYHANGQFKECLQQLDALDATTYRDYRNDRDLLRARCYERLGRSDEAVDLLEKLSATSTGEEARCCYALMLERRGDNEKAKEVFERMLFDAKHANADYRKREKKWLHIAREHLRH